MIGKNTLSLRQYIERKMFEKQLLIFSREECPQKAYSLNVHENVDNNYEWPVKLVKSCVSLFYICISN